MIDRVKSPMAPPITCSFSRNKHRSLFCFFALCLVAVLAVYSLDGLYDGHLSSQSSSGSHGLRARSAKSIVQKRQAAEHDADTAPQAPLAFTDTPETINKTVKAFVEKEKAIVDEIVKRVKDPNEATFDNTIKPYLEHEDAMRTKTATIGIYISSSPDRDLQQAAGNTGSVFDDAIQKTFLNEEFYKRVNIVYTKQKDDQKLSEESRRVIENIWDQFKNYGVEVPAGEKRYRFQAINKRLSELSNEFGMARSRDQTTLWFTKEELNGTESEVLDGLPKGTGEHEGKLKVVLANPDTAIITRDCTNETVREQIYVKMAQRVPDNIGRLKEAVRLRDEKARLRGYANFAEVTIKDKMAETPRNVTNMLQSVRDRLTPHALKDRDRLKDLKKKSVGKADHLFTWDEAFYQTRSQEEEFQLKVSEVKQYFPAKHTMQEILKLYADLFGLVFTRIEGVELDKLAPSGKGRDLVWQDDVQLYRVDNSPAWEGEKRPSRKRGARSAKEASENSFVGYLYLDLYFREGKGPGAYQTPLEPGFLLPDGKKRHYPSGALTTNFRKSDSDKPSLLARSEVQTILHELGHAIHHLTSTVTYSRFHGPGGTPADWFEMPSQMMENWSFIPEVLSRLSQHWNQTTPEAKEGWKKHSSDPQPIVRIPPDMLEKIVKLKNSYSAMGELVQVAYGTYDMTLHTPSSQDEAFKLDTTLLYNSIRANITHTEGPEVLGKGLKWGHGQSANFGHIMSGYEAGYYSYLWSKVYSADAFKTAFEKNPFSGEAGRRFRREILEPGGSKDLEGMLEGFLGHKATNEAYFESLGL